MSSQNIEAFRSSLEKSFASGEARPQRPLDKGEMWKIEYFSARLKAIQAAIEDQEQALQGMNPEQDPQLELATLRELRQLNNHQESIRRNLNLLLRH